jgi:hypothetical protein
MIRDDHSVDLASASRAKLPKKDTPVILPTVAIVISLKDVKMAKTSRFADGWHGIVRAAFVTCFSTFYKTAASGGRIENHCR